MSKAAFYHNIYFIDPDMQPFLIKSATKSCEDMLFPPRKCEWLVAGDDQRLTWPRCSYSNSHWAHVLEDGQEQGLIFKDKSSQSIPGRTQHWGVGGPSVPNLPSNILLAWPDRSWNWYSRKVADVSENSSSAGGTQPAVSFKYMFVMWLGWLFYVFLIIPIGYLPKAFHLSLYHNLATQNNHS